MQEFKVGDMVKVLNIPGLDPTTCPEIVGKVFKVIYADVERDAYMVESEYSFVYYANDLELQLQSPKALNGHIWLITNKQTGKVIEVYRTRKEARENFCNYNNPPDLKIVKYTFN